MLVVVQRFRRRKVSRLLLELIKPRAESILSAMLCAEVLFTDNVKAF
jgi:hypothetical protein